MLFWCCFVWFWSMCGGSSGGRVVFYVRIFFWFLFRMFISWFFFMSLCGGSVWG